jgi:hypothetical protein
MNITRNNYESWFLDYLEGNLDGKMMDEFTEFIRSNPDLGEELRDYEAVKLDIESIVFEGKNKLYKERLDIPSAFDQEAVAFMEGDLSCEESTHFQDYLRRHPEKSPDLESFLKTKLLPDNSLVFSHKQKLFKKAGHSAVLSWTSRVAAVLLLLLAVYIWPDQPEDVSENKLDPIAEINPSEEVSEKMSGDLVNQKINLATTSAMLPNKKNPAIKQRNMKRNAPVESARTEISPTENIRYEIPALLPSISGLISMDVPVRELAQAKNDNNRIGSAEDLPESQYLSEVLIEKLRLNEIHLNKVLRTGLDLVVQLTNKKFSYHEDHSGKIIAYQLETRLLGFSLPVGKSGHLHNRDNIQAN